MGLFVSSALPKGPWSDPVNLGVGIHTEHHGTSPSLSPDSPFIFFSRHDEEGGVPTLYGESAEALGPAYPAEPQSRDATAQRPRASANPLSSGISSGGSPEAASIRPLKLKNEASAVISQIALSSHPASLNAATSSWPTKLGVSVSLLA